MTDFSHIYDGKIGAFLKLMKIAHGDLHTVKEVQISKTAKKISITFSEDNKMLGISYVERRSTFIKVFSSPEQNIEQMMDDYANQKFFYQYQQKDTYIKNITFDRHFKYLVGYGDTRVLIMNL
jgi:hypothetical protein